MITLLISTRNRSDFLGRLLSYYARLGFEGRIVVGDSSDVDHVEPTKKLIEELSGKADIDYRQYPGMNGRECTKALFDLVATKYVTVVADDDFLIPDSMERCIQFLEAHPEYIAARGSAALFTLQSTGAYGQFEYVVPYNQCATESESAAQRLADHLGSYSMTLFSVYRSEVCRAMYRTSVAPDRAFAEELLPTCLSVIYGKHKMLDCLYMVRQHHQRRNVLDDVFDWVTNPLWLTSYETFRDSLVEAIVDQDEVSPMEAQAVVKQAFWSYLAQGMPKKWRDNYTQSGSGFGSGALQSVRRMQLLKKTWRQVRSFFPGQTNKLPVLLRPGSQYHAVFMPIYRAVTGPPTPNQCEANQKSPA